MSYFVSRDELLWEIQRAVDNMFSAVSTCLSDEDKKFNRKFAELRNEFLLLINTMGQQSHQLRNKKRGVRKMEEKERKFEEILKELISHILKGNDEKLIILADELEQSTEKFKEEKYETIIRKLTEIREKTKAFLKQQEEDEKKKEEEKKE